MKKSFITLLGIAALVGLMAAPAYAAVEVEIFDASHPTGTIFFGTSCGPDCSQILVSDADAQFSIDIQTASSTGPSGPASLSVTGQVRTAPGVTFPQNLTVEVSDTNFVSPTGGANLVQTVNTNTAVNGAAKGSLTGTGYYGTGAGNVFFCVDTSSCTAATPSASFNSFLVSNPGQTTQTGVDFVAPYSLDEVLKYSFTGAGTADVTATLSAVVPEPATILLLGTGLIGVGLLFRKKVQSKQR